MHLALRASLALTAVAATALALPAASSAASACPDGQASQQRALLQSYQANARVTVRQLQGRDGQVRAVLADLPPIAFDGPGSTPDLPLGPCAAAYRLASGAVVVDWSTEGVPHFSLRLHRRPGDRAAAATLTLGTLQEAVGAADHELRFHVDRPARVGNGRPWPTRLVVRHRPTTGAFVVGFTRWRAVDAAAETESADVSWPRPPVWPPFTEVTRYVGEDTGGNSIELYPVVQAPPNVQIVSITPAAHGDASDPNETSFQYSPDQGYCNDENTPDVVVAQLTNGIQTGPVTVNIVVSCF